MPSSLYRSILALGVLFTSLSQTSQAACVSKYFYDNDGADWTSGQCTGSMQSPIDIFPENVQSTLDESFGVSALRRISVEIDGNQRESNKYQSEGDSSDSDSDSTNTDDDDSDQHGGVYFKMSNTGTSLAFVLDSGSTSTFGSGNDDSSGGKFDVDDSESQSDSDSSYTIPRITMEGGITPEGSQFCFAQFHFHWGVDDHEGSEHVIKGQAAPLEAHFIFHDCEYDDLGAAIDASVSQTGAESGYKVAVVGLMIDVEDVDGGNTYSNSDSDGNFGTIVNAMADLAEAKSETVIELNLSDDQLFGLIAKHGDFYSYLGSLTTPDCLEIIRWHVLKRRITVTDATMNMFRTSLLTCEGATMTNNWRIPVQNTNPLWSVCTNCQATSINDACTMDYRSWDCQKQARHAREMNM